MSRAETSMSYAAATINILIAQMLYAREIRVFLLAGRPH